jgi:hypothetical protein
MGVEALRLLCYFVPLFNAAAAQPHACMERPNCVALELPFLWLRLSPRSRKRGRAQSANAEGSAMRRTPILAQVFAHIFAHIGAALLLAPCAAVAQEQIPAGTLVPISLDHTINADKVRPGQQIRAEVMQDIPGTPIRRRAKMLGHVVEATPSTSGAARLEISFDSVRVRGQSIPIKASLRALASYFEVEAAETAEDLGTRGTTPETATYQQIGGEQVYRGGGPVAAGLTVVGTPTPYGVLGLPRTQLGQPCRGVIAGNTHPQAFWLFSTDACGVYGFDNIRIVDAGRTSDSGITFAAEKGKLKLGIGSGMLLRVQGS